MRNEAVHQQTSVYTLGKKKKKIHKREKERQKRQDKRKRMYRTVETSQEERGINRKKGLKWKLREKKYCDTL